MQSYQRFQHVGHTAFNISGTNGSRSFSQVKAGTHLPSPTGSYTPAHTAKHGAFRMGGGITTLGAFRTFTNIPGPGIRTANFAALGTWSRVLSKNAESLRNSDALMRVDVPRRRGPAGLRRFGWGWYHYPRSVPHVSETLRGRGLKRQTLPFSEVRWA